jgi:HEAT repeat protein
VLGPHPRRDQRYFLRVWAARALLYAWDDSAQGAVLDALADESWRVREMVAKVVARRKLGDALAAVAGLSSDPVPRVRAAAARAAMILTAAGA